MGKLGRLSIAKRNGPTAPQTAKIKKDVPVKPWVLFLPFAAIVVLSGYFGFQIGRAAPPSEGEVIARWADEYTRWAGEGASPTDCSAKPGMGEVWMVITCVPNGTLQSITYHVTRAGELARPQEILSEQEA